ncbi:MAG: hypothetical protein RDV48_21010 [Candidatus Eremiobacteraeota bacterium]|nr:hypothetical protein [Candidatus Eremiobacteraeota bacterium]
MGDRGDYAQTIGSISMSGAMNGASRAAVGYGNLHTAADGAYGAMKGGAEVFGYRRRLEDAMDGDQDRAVKRGSMDYTRDEVFRKKSILGALESIWESIRH